MNLSPSVIDLRRIPDVAALQGLCKALATLDAVICRDWDERYYSYDKNWDTAKEEECFSMRDGCGDEFLILFSPHGVVINGFACDSDMNGWRERVIEPQTLREKFAAVFGKTKTVMEQHIYPGVVDTLPTVFHDFVFGEPNKSIGTTFCIWRQQHDSAWQRGNISFPPQEEDDDYADGSGSLLEILNNDPNTYKEWADTYYDEEFEGRTLELDWVKYIYEQYPLTKTLVTALNPVMDDFETLKSELDTIGYPYQGL